MFSLSQKREANLSDGPFVGKYLLICPTAVFAAKGYDVDGTPFTKGADGGTR